MATKKVNIDIIAKDKSKQALNKVRGNLDGVKKSVFNLRNAFIGLGAGAVIKNIIGVGKEIENLQVRLKFLFGSTQEGAKAFDEMAKFASKVPFSLAEIQKGAGVLAVVSKDAEELAKNMELTGNVAAVTGLDFKTTAEQIQRSLSAGIGAADLFRDRGVKAMLGFKAGAKVSIEETVEAFDRVFGNGGEFAGATDELAKTFEGTLSMIGDKIFNFKRTILEAGFFPELKKQFSELDKFLANESEALDEIAKTIGVSLAQALKTLADVVIVVKDNFELLKIAVGAFIAYKLTAIIYGLVGALKLMYKQLVGVTALSGPKGLGLIVASFVAMELATRNWKKEVVDAREELKKLTLSELVKKAGELELQILKLNQANESLKEEMESVSEGSEKMEGHFDFLNDTLAQIPENLQLLANEYDDNTKNINNLNKELAILNRMLDAGEGKTGRLIEVYGALDNDLKDFIETSKKVTAEVVKLIEVNGVLDGDFKSLHPTLTATKEHLDALRDAYFEVDEETKELVNTYDFLSRNIGKVGSAWQDASVSMGLNTEMLSHNNKKVIEHVHATDIMAKSMEQVPPILQKQFHAWNSIRDIMKDVVVETENVQTRFGSFKEGFADAMDTDIFAKFEEIGKKTFDSLTKMLTDFVTTGKMNFEDFARVVVRMITEALIGQAVQFAINKAVELFKAGAIREALVDVYGAAVRAFKNFGGWPFGVMAAGATIAAGMGLVKTMQGFEKGGKPPVGVPSIVGEGGPELFVPNSAGTIIPNNQLGGGKPVTVNFNINTVDARGFNELLVNSRGVIVNMINSAVNEKGKVAII